MTVSAVRVASADDSKPPPTKEEQAVAGRKFKEGLRAFAKHDYANAAKLFEEAYAIAPHPDAMMNAADARDRAGDLLLSAQNCQRVLADFPNDKAAEDARAKLGTLTPKLGRLDVQTKGLATDVTVDGAASHPGEVFVDPGDHVVEAKIWGELVTRRVNVVAGARENVLLEPPPKEAPKAITPAPPRDEKPLHPAFFFVGLGLTAAAGGVMIWSGVDTNQARDDFDASPTQQGLDDGRSKQLRTNVLIGVTAGLGVATGAIGVFATEWGGDDAPGEPPSTARLVVGPGFSGVSGTFR
jgi:hypothetical protein